MFVAEFGTGDVFLSMLWFFLASLRADGAISDDEYRRLTAKVMAA